MGITAPEEITTARLEAYYKKTRKDQSEATAQTYVTRVATFARAQGLRITAPKFTAEKPSREITIAAVRVGELLEKATDPELKFILMAGFRAGLRRAEISMARPAWFDLENGLIRIPAKDPVSGFVPKSKRARTIPLVSEFAHFIRENFPDWKTRAWCIRPEKEMGAWIYRFDFRKMFAAFARKNCPELTPHVMRHSYASHLANGGVGIAQLASWVGDRIATLEKHYLHLQADAEKAEGAFSGESPAKKTEQVHALMMEFLEAQKTDLGKKLKGAELAAFEKVFGSMETQLARAQAEK
jgi:integrase